MANTTSKISILLAVSLFIIIIVTKAESRSILGGVIKASSKLSCNTVIGVEKGDTCFGIENTYNLTSTDFNAINPNLNCTAIFVGQWLCIDGSLN